MAKADSFTSENLKQEIYSDFLTDLNPHPVTGDLVKFTNENAVAKSIRNLLLTNRGERFYQPELGSDMQKMLFEPISEETGNLIKTFIQQTIKEFEPRAKVLDIVMTPVIDRNLYVATITFFTINRQQPVTVNLSLVRVR